MKNRNFFLSFIISISVFITPSPYTYLHAEDSQIVSAEMKSDMALEPDNFVLITGGESIIGNENGLEDERPERKIYISDFYIRKYEVSNKAYRKFLDETDYPPPAFWKDKNFNKPNYPVVGISWHDAAAYSKWAGENLPTEAQWEKAAKKDREIKWPWGNKRPRRKEMVFYSNLFSNIDYFNYTAPVDYYPAGASPYGIFNMIGNVWEWCLDWYAPNYYRSIDKVNPLGPKSGKRKVLRGGSWTNSLDSISNFRRISNFPEVKLNNYGFRTVLISIDNFPDKLRSLLNNTQSNDYLPVKKNLNYL